MANCFCFGQIRLNALTRKLGKKLFAAGSLGADGWIFADLLEHEFMVSATSLVLLVS